MALFKKQESTSCFLKAGFLGFAGSGKTFTSTSLAVGLALMLKERKLPQGGRPIMFLDSETGSDYIAHIVRDAGLELFSAKSRSMVDCAEAITECEQNGSVLIIDSITHCWRDFCDSYRRKKNRQRLEMLDWVTLKEEWARVFTDRYVNSAAHIIICGRAGFEYEHELNEITNKKELVKSGIRMAAEKETGFEPSLLVLMEREMDMRTNAVVRTANILKERFDIIDGKCIANPTFEDFKPHIDRLNLGGAQLGVDTSRSADELFSAGDGDSQWKYERQQKEIALDEIKEEIAKHCGQGQSAEDKKARGDLLERISGTRSWSRLENEKWEKVKTARNALWLESRGHAFGENPAPIPTPEAAPA